jgi:hypothetical protein
LQARHKLFSWFVKCERLFGFETFEISVPSLPPGVVINDPKNLEFVLKNEGIFGKGAFFKLRSWDLFGESSYTSRLVVGEGKVFLYWRKHYANNFEEMVLSMLTASFGSCSARRDLNS